MTVPVQQQGLLGGIVVPDNDPEVHGGDSRQLAIFDASTRTSGRESDEGERFAPTTLFAISGGFVSPEQQGRRHVLRRLSVECFNGLAGLSCRSQIGQQTVYLRGVLAAGWAFLRGDDQGRRECEISNPLIGNCDQAA